MEWDFGSRFVFGLCCAAAGCVYGGFLGYMVAIFLQPHQPPIRSRKGGG